MPGAYVRAGATTSPGMGESTSSVISGGEVWPPDYEGMPAISPTADAVAMAPPRDETPNLP
jgi:hypothetical protein